MESKGWRSSEGALLSLIWLELKSRHRRYIWVGFVVGSLLWSEMFFFWVLRFSLPLKNQHFEIPIGPLDVLPLNRIIIIIFIIIIIIVISIIITLIIIIIVIIIIIHYGISGLWGLLLSEGRRFRGKKTLPVATRSIAIYFC